MTRQKLCPRCGSYQIYRSHRTAFERILFFLRPYRCGICHYRFTLLQSRRSPHHPDGPSR